MGHISDKEKPARTALFGRARLTLSRVIGVYGGLTSPLGRHGHWGWLGTEIMTNDDRLVATLTAGARREVTTITERRIPISH